MELWQKKAADEMKEFLYKHLRIESVTLSGSMLEQSTLDRYSDVDMNIYLENNTSFKILEFINVLSGRFDVFGYETHHNDNNETLRVCFDNGWRFDLTFFMRKKNHLTPLIVPLRIRSTTLRRVFGLYPPWF